MAVSPDSSLLAAVSHTGPASLVSPALTGTEKACALLGTLAVQPHMSGHQRFLRDWQQLPTYSSEVCIAQLSAKAEPEFSVAMFAQLYSVTKAEYQKHSQVDQPI